MSNPIQEFRGYIENNKFSFMTQNEENRFKTYLTSIKTKSKKRTEIKMIIKKYRDGRTSGQSHEKSNQNGYYYGVVLPTLIKADPFIGQSVKDMDYGLRANFNRVGGSEAFPETISFSDLSAVNFERKMEEIRIWALSEYQIEIETVEDYYKLNN